MKTENRIRKRKDGRYEARYFAGRKDDGSIKYGYCYGSTYEEAEAKRNNVTNRKQESKKMNLIIMGAGFVGNEYKEICESLRIFNKINFLEDIKTNTHSIGKCIDVDKYVNEYPVGLVAIKNRELRKLWQERLKNNNFIIPTIIHPSATVSKDAIIGAGTVVYPGASIGSKVEIGEGCIICSGAIVNRNTKIDSWSFVDSGQVINSKNVDKLQCEGDR